MPLSHLVCSLERQAARKQNGVFFGVTTQERVKWFMCHATERGCKVFEVAKTERKKEEEGDRYEEKCCSACRPGPTLAHDSLQMKCHPGRQ